MSNLCKEIMKFSFVVLESYIICSNFMLSIQWYFFLIQNRPSRTKFFSRQGFFFEKFAFDKRCKNEFNDNYEKLCGRLSVTISKKWIFQHLVSTEATRQRGSWIISLLCFLVRSLSDSLGVKNEIKSHLYFYWWFLATLRPPS